MASSWFSVDRLKGLSEQVSEQVTSAASAAAVHVPKLDREFVQKLTLTSPELRAEHDRIDQEERRKEEVRDMLAGMLPWETRDAERDILVEECKEAVLKLSSTDDAFLGPYEMPKLKVNMNKKEAKKKTGGDVDEGDGEQNNIGGDDDDLLVEDGGGEKSAAADDDGGEEEEEAEGQQQQQQRKPSEESLERLKALEPLPPLLQEFDLDSHVGLINRLLKEDPNLVAMQSKLSGGGEHEKVFWRNYFFHCAWCRYEAGLSVDEMWSDLSSSSAMEAAAAAAATVGAGKEGAEAGTPEEETITFESELEEALSADEKSFPADPVTDVNAPFGNTKGSLAATEPEAVAPSAAVVAAASESRSEPDFEMVGPSSAEIDADGPELDELEAEIARELED